MIYIAYVLAVTLCTHCTYSAVRTPLTQRDIVFFINLVISYWNVWLFGCIGLFVLECVCVISLVQQTFKKLSLELLVLFLCDLQRISPLIGLIRNIFLIWWNVDGEQRLINSSVASHRSTTTGTQSHCQRYDMTLLRGTIRSLIMLSLWTNSNNVPLPYRHMLVLVYPSASFVMHRHRAVRVVHTHKTTPTTHIISWTTGKHRLWELLFVEIKALHNE